MDFNPDVFRGKTILLPCDDPEWSNFTRYFAQNFERFGLKKLISTSYAAESKNIKFPYQPSLFETESPHFDKAKTAVKGKIFMLDKDSNKSGKIDIDDANDFGTIVLHIRFPPFLATPPVRGGGCGALRNF